MNRIVSLSAIAVVFAAIGCGNQKPEPVKVADQPSMMAPKDEKGRVKANDAPKYNATP
jgi:hypothetical protein